MLRIVMIFYDILFHLRTRTKDRTTDWFMRINPNGEEKTCKGFVSLFLYKDGVCEVPINADIIFSIIDKDGSKVRGKR